jgi:hypothetical protein
MANADLNNLVKNYRGKVGGLIFRLVGGRTVVSVLPDYRGRKWTKAQKANRRRFRKGMDYAREILKDPVMALFYKKKIKKKNQSAWNMAVSDYMKNPELAFIDGHSYKGAKGDQITVGFKDRHRLTEVIVGIVDAQGFQVESGKAEYNPFLNTWVYRAVETNTSIKGGRIAVIATDFNHKVVRDVLTL